LCERHRIVDLFNDPTSDIAVLIANGRVASYGINLHHASRDLVIVDPPMNVSSILQMIGRVHRPGQQHVPEIVILSKYASYDSIVEARTGISHLSNQDARYCQCC
jgi:superfamily II DNA or RNA helicase